MVIFPSVINHSVDELKMSSQDLNKKILEDILWFSLVISDEE